MSDAESKKTLENALGGLLGFDDGEAEDLLEHLLSIDSSEDLSEYLVQLMGGQSPELNDFVQNMSRYKSGESITTSSSAQNDSDSKAHQKKAAIDSFSQENAAVESFRAMAMGNNSKSSKKSASRKNTRQKQQGNKSRVPPPKNVNNSRSPLPPSASAVNESRKQQPSSSSSNSQAQNVTLQQQSKQQQKRNKGVVEKSHPARGKPKIVCGCFGTKYKALTNCLYCGRISCEKEGYDFCPFCGFMVEPGLNGNEKAFLQKERLLRFDRDFARRTKVFDDQADFQAPSTWMSEEEKKEAEENELKHFESLKRPKQTLKLAI